MHAFIIALFVLHGQATLLKSGDDDYYADPDGKPKDVQVQNAKREDTLALDIYKKLVSGKSDASCPSLKHWVSAYANDETKWESVDKKNPEFPTKATKETQNALNVKLRANINTVLKKKDLKCHEIFHMVSCPFTGIRFLAAYEFVFKKPGVEWSDTVGVRDSVNVDRIATEAYNLVKCGKQKGQCTKLPPAKSKVLKLFMDDKGREQNKTLKPEVIIDRMIGGIAGSPVMNSGKVVEGSADLKDFWSASEQQKLFNAKQQESFTAAEKEIVKPAEVGHGPPAQRHMPARSGSAFDDVVKHFEECGVPWIGGVSGSVLEMFAYAQYKGTPINDVFVLQWMSLYVLAGFHSMGEIWSALKPMLEAFGLTETKELSIVGVPAPFNLKDGCVEVGGEEKFLTALTGVVEKVTR